MRSKPKSLPRLPRTWLPRLLFLGGLMVTGVLFAADTGPRRHAQGAYDAAADRYEVAAGDALSGIALRFGTSIAELHTLNKLTDDRILVGQAVVIGASGDDQPTAAAAEDDPLPLWQDGGSKQAIIGFVEAVTDESSPSFVPSEDRIATFDNDGTLWPSHPMYTQLAFALDRVKALAPEHPEWKTTQPFQAALENDMEALAAAGEKGLIELIMASHAGMSQAEFAQIVTEWFKTAKHPKFNRLYTKLAYQPMLELLGFLRANGFTTYIVSGGGVEFMRPMTLEVYGIPAQQVIGSSIKTEYKVVSGEPQLLRRPEIGFIDDKVGKPVGINHFIGKRPIAAFGNSDGDRQMLEWTGAGEGKRLMMLVLHDDAEREYAYGPANGLPDTKFGTFSQNLMEEARDKDWHVISMKNDWKQIFAPAP